MEEAVKTLTELGTVAIDILWLPVGIWTIIALSIVAALKIFDTKISAVYHYHTRVAMLGGLLAGVIGSAFFYWLPFSSSVDAGAAAKFIVIQSPISITVTATSTAIDWSDPTIWAGGFTILALLLGVGALLKFLVDFISLQSIARNLPFSNSDLKERLTDRNKNLLQSLDITTKVYFSDDIAIPCTFGWFKKKIILPIELAADSEKLNMALRHELAHITNKDYLLNISVQIIKALFFFHPLVHKLTTDTEDYREIYCDLRVLQDDDISKKNYASLLFELSPKSVFKPASAVNMAVRPSTLKKRINAMAQSNQSLPSLKWSLTLMLVSTLILTGLMACSDIEDNGITRSEVEDAQLDMHANIDLDEPQPLYVINGEVQSSEDPDNPLARIKPKYINSIEVLKGEDAIDAYGQDAQNGVIIMDVEEKAFDDLRTTQEMKVLREEKQNKAVNNTSPEQKVFMAVENDPKLIGGIQELQQNVEYPEQCKQAGIEGRVFLSFIVNKEGNVEEPEVIRGIGESCDRAALEAVKNHAKFKPGMQRGKPVKTQFSLSILFRLSDNSNDTGNDAEMEQAVKDGLSIRNLNYSNGTVNGQVYDKNSGQVVASANVLIPSLQRGAATNQNGEFEITNINAENFKLRVSFVGYKTLIASVEN